LVSIESAWLSLCELPTVVKCQRLFFITSGSDYVVLASTVRANQGARSGDVAVEARSAMTLGVDKGVCHCVIRGFVRC
jgi:hypothetical protein